MHRRVFLAVGLGAVLALACTKGPALKELTVDQVAQRLAANDGKTLPIDCNSHDRWQKGHVPGAKWVDYENVTAADLPQDKGITLVFYCASEL